MSKASRDRAARLVRLSEQDENRLTCEAEHQLDNTGRTFPCFDAPGHEGTHVDEYGREWMVEVIEAVIHSEHPGYLIKTKV